MLHWDPIWLAAVLHPSEPPPSFSFPRSLCAAVCGGDGPLAALLGPRRGPRQPGGAGRLVRRVPGARRGRCGSTFVSWRVLVAGRFRSTENRGQSLVAPSSSVSTPSPPASPLAPPFGSVEGKQLGIDDELVALLGRHSPLPVTYAGGARALADLERVRAAGGGRVDVTVGSALDCFGGKLPYADVVAWHRQQAASAARA